MSGLSINPAIVRTIQPVSPDTMVAYVMTAGVSVMCPPALQSRFAPETLNLNIKYHVAFHVLISRLDHISIIQQHECNADCFHFQCYRWSKPALLLICIYAGNLYVSTLMKITRYTHTPAEATLYTKWRFDAASWQCNERIASFEQDDQCNNLIT